MFLVKLLTKTRVRRSGFFFLPCFSLIFFLNLERKKFENSIFHACEFCFFGFFKCQKKSVGLVGKNYVGSGDQKRTTFFAGSKYHVIVNLPVEHTHSKGS